MTTQTAGPFSPPVPTNWSEDQIEEVAEQIAKTLGFKPGSDIRSFVERELGAKVVVDNWREPAPAGSIEVRGPRDFTIWLSPYTVPARDNFTIAHELGHYFLHSKMGKHRIEVRREGDDRGEQEANCFAAAFLLPRAAFLKAWKEAEGDAVRIAAKFGVSASVVEVRARRLNAV